MDYCRHCHQPIRFYPGLGWLHLDPGPGPGPGWLHLNGGSSHCGGWDEPDTPRAEPGEDNE